MSFGTLMFFVALFAGYGIRVNRPSILKWISQSLLWITLGILFLMGYGLGSLDNVAENLMVALEMALLFLVCISLANLLGLFPVIRMTTGEASGIRPPFMTMLMESLMFAGVVVLGLIAGVLLNKPFAQQEMLANGLLYCMLVLVGIQLRSGNVAIKDVLLNKTGMRIAATVTVTAFFGGLIAGWIAGVPANVSLALASGFGWYSLSGIMIGDQLGPVYGSVAFMVDLSRELVALLLIPFVIRRNAPMAIGYGGATAMDYTLPVIERTGGVHCVPVAVASGFILSLAAPLLIPMFLGVA
ncbi:lysine exporter LysO family protein [Parendozoicomonas haliclonae]|uniref:Lysine exporter LysO n=1 Tax=Parendozoicomonas haliclonae TaxID=1960125 RepID=A0A1X7AKU0_9GAMM|nr:lysine exporter LysO family protein [Parendozoicomonas haliclonae]SMA48226.1 hypothetical protein EHSB41UT_02657 [Parendozoicomonas haliclonae]